MRNAGDLERSAQLKNEPGRLGEFALAIVARGVDAVAAQGFETWTRSHFIEEAPVAIDGPVEDVGGDGRELHAVRQRRGFEREIDPRAFFARVDFVEPIGLGFTLLEDADVPRNL